MIRALALIAALAALIGPAAAQFTFPITMVGTGGAASCSPYRVQAAAPYRNAATAPYRIGC